MKKVKVYIIDDHKLFVEGISSLLADEPDLELMGYSLSAEDFLENFNAIAPDVYLVDINMPQMNGIELSRLIREKKPGAQILALTMFEDYQYVEKMIQTGVNGYVLKTASLTELVKAIKTVATGEKFLGSKIQQLIFNKIGTSIPQTSQTKEEKPVSILSEREKEILALVAREFSNQEIAEKLFISERTVQTHRKNIFSKTQAKSIVGLIKYAIKHGIVKYE
ncbi:MAG: response regulator [Bacteroidales bacterium]